MRRQGDVQGDGKITAASPPRRPRSTVRRSGRDWTLGRMFHRLTRSATTRDVQGPRWRTPYKVATVTSVESETTGGQRRRPRGNVQRLPRFPSAASPPANDSERQRATARQSADRSRFDGQLNQRTRQARTSTSTHESLTRRVRLQCKLYTAFYIPNLNSDSFELNLSRSARSAVHHNKRTSVTKSSYLSGR